MESTLSTLCSRVVYPLLEDLDCPRSLTVALLVRNEEWAQLVSMRAIPEQYSNADEYLRAAAATDLLRKADFLDTGIDTAQKAWNTWVRCEHECAKTNARLLPYVTNGPFEDPSGPAIADHLDKLKRLAKRILGKVPKTLELKHGPGSTFNDTIRNGCTIPDKMQHRPTISSNCLALIPDWEGTAWYRGLVESCPDDSTPEITRGNRFVCVPKDATTDRPIAIEASINVTYQLALGQHIRKRLKLFGLDLNNGQAHHRRVACEASQSQEFCTVDLSSASDTVARLLVKLLLPEDWFELLATVRSETTLVQEFDIETHELLSVKHYVLQKFSSMGNGFTFELETLLFACIAFVATMESGEMPVLGHNVLVYGDDIIVPTNAARNLLALLKFLGFTPNQQKTFVKGPFRESCGGDFYMGASVRPHFIKEFPNDPTAWISLANGLRRLGNQFADYPGARNPIQRAWFRTLEFIPSDIRRCRGPEALGDVVIHDRPQSWQVRVRSSIRYIRVWRPVSTSIPVSKIVVLQRALDIGLSFEYVVVRPAITAVFGHWKSGPSYAAALYGVPSSGPIPRLSEGAVQGYRFGRVAYS